MPSRPWSIPTFLALCAGACTGGGGADGSASGDGTGSDSGPTDSSAATGGVTEATESSVGSVDAGTVDATGVDSDTASAEDGSGTADSGTTEGDGSTDDEGSSDEGSSTGGAAVPQCDVDVVCTGDTVWSQQHGNTDDMSSSEGIDAVATAPDGTSIIAGAVDGSIDFGVLGTIEGESTGFIAKVDTDGDVLWVRQLQGEWSFSARAVDIDANGNSVVTGAVGGDLEAAGTVTPGGSTSSDAYLAGFDANGELRFASVFPSTGPTAFDDVVAHPDGNIAAVGHFTSTINLGGSQLNATSGSEDAVIGVFDSDGEHLWSRRYGDAGGQWGEGVAFDDDGNAIVSARNYGVIDFGGLAHDSPDSFAIALAKLDGETGERVWSRQFEDTLNNSAGFPRIEAEGDSIYLGTYSSSASLHGVDFGLGVEEAYFYVVRFDQDGQTQWVRGIDALRGVQALEPDEGGHVLVVGDLQGSADFGGTDLASFMNSYDAFVAKYDAASGALQWGRAIGDVNQQPQLQRAFGVGTDADGFVYVGGRFTGAINFGDGQLLSSNGFGGSDAFFAKLEP